MKSFLKRLEWWLNKIFHYAWFLIVLIGLVQLIYTKMDVWELQKKVDTLTQTDCDPDQVFRMTRQSIVRVLGGTGEGSGVMVSKDGTIVTNFHVVADNPSPRVVLYSGKMLNAKIIMTDKDKDLAFIKIEGVTVAPLVPNPQAVASLKRLSTIYAFGYPYGTQIVGEVSAQKMSYSNHRGIYIQTDKAPDPGQSGGALVDNCGKLIGITSMSVGGLGVAISADTVLDTWSNLINNSDPKTQVTQYDFQPNVSPVEAVKAFYNYQTTYQLEKAYELLSKNFVQGMDFEEWSQGYKNVVAIELFKVTASPNNPNLVEVKFGSKDFSEDDVLYKTFEGSWEVKNENGQLRLFKPEIREVKEPDFMWFYE